MSNFSNQANKKEETRRVESGRREALGKYFYDLSKLTFAGLVLGLIVPLTQDFQNMLLYGLFVVGAIMVYFFAFLGNKFHGFK